MGLMRPADMAAEDSMKEAERRVTLGSRSGSGGSCALVAEADLALTLHIQTMWPWETAYEKPSPAKSPSQSQENLIQYLCTHIQGPKQGAAALQPCSCIEMIL